jgi:hypothetical protein
LSTATLKKTLSQVIEEIVSKEEKMWTRDRLQPMAKFLEERFTEWSEILGLPSSDLLQNVESKRSYSAINYYQDSKMPSLKKVRIFKTQAELLAAIGEKEFRCPLCSQISTNPYKCNSGAKVKTKSGICDWSVGGLFGDLGKGAKILVTEMMDEVPFPDSIFMPIAWEKLNESKSN